MSAIEYFHVEKNCIHSHSSMHTECLHKIVRDVGGPQNEFKLQLCYYIHFQTKPLEKV